MKKTTLIQTDYKNRFNRRIWLNERRHDLQYYFDMRHINYGQISKEPFWSIIPRSSLWHIPSLETPGFDGWFGIAGDHPTDVVPLNYINGSPRNILEHFVEKWLQAAARLKQGEAYGDFRIEQIEERPTVGELIENRAMKLKRWVETEELWQTIVPFLITPSTENDSREED